MTCFWDGLVVALSSLTSLISPISSMPQSHISGVSPLNDSKSKCQKCDRCGSISKRLMRTWTVESLIEYLRKKNRPTKKVKWNGEKLRPQLLQENIQHIGNFSAARETLNAGYDCSTCDPFLLLVAQLFRVTIYHNYNGNHIWYKRKHARQVLCFSSNKYHFEFRGVQRV